MSNPALVIEDVETVEKRKLFDLLNVEWYTTPQTWLSVPETLAAGYASALFFRLTGDIKNTMGWGLAFAGMLNAANFIHSIGHILGGKLVNDPMVANLMTATRHINIYDEENPERKPAKVHISRAAGGPVMNIAAGLLSLFMTSTSGKKFLIFAGLINLGIGILSLLPLESADGEVIARELRG